jgi:flagellar hook-length control protein FliK
MISAAPSPNTTLLNANSPPAANFGARSSDSNAPSAFTGVLSSVQANYPQPKNSTTLKSQDAASSNIARPKNSTPAGSIPSATSSQSSATAANIPASAPTATSAPTPPPPAGASGTAVPPPSDAQTANLLATVQLQALAAAQASPSQISSPAAAPATPSPASAPAPNGTASSASGAALQINAGSSGASSSADAAATLLTASSAETSAAGASATVQAAPKNSPLAPALGAEQLTELAQRLRSPTALESATPPLAASPAKASTPANPAPPPAAPKQTLSPELLASITGNSPANAPLAAQKVSGSQDQITQDVATKLQAALIVPETNKIPAAPASAPGSGNPAGDGSNQSPQNSDSPASSGPANNLAQILTASQSAASNEGIEKNQGTDSAVAAKAAGLIAASVDQGLHAPADAPGSSAWVDAGSSSPQTVKENIPVTTAPPAPPPPAPLPASLSDVAQASQLYQHIGGAEMHIAMQTELLGSIELHTVVHQSTLSATIGVQRADVQSLLANDLPALQHALAEQRFQVNQISVLNNSVGGRLDQGGQQQQQQQNASTPSTAHVPAALEFNRGSAEESIPGWSEVSVLGEYAGQLSIRV